MVGLKRLVKCSCDKPLHCIVWLDPLGLLTWCQRTSVEKPLRDDSLHWHASLRFLVRRLMASLQCPATNDASYRLLDMFLQAWKPKCNTWCVTTDTVNSLANVLKMKKEAESFRSTTLQFDRNWRLLYVFFIQSACRCNTRPCPLPRVLWVVIIASLLTSALQVAPTESEFYV